MTLSPNMRRRASPGSLLLVFLAVILAMSLGLGYHAIATARSHRETVENALHDYASMAAWEFSRVCRENLEWVLGRVFDDVPRRLRDSELPPPEVFARELDRTLGHLDCDCPGLRNPPWYFRVDLRDTSAATSPDTVSPVVVERLIDTLVGHVDSLASRRGLITVAPGQILGSPTMIAYAMSAGRSGTPVAVFGFIADARETWALFARWFDGRSLFPPAIAGTQPNDSLLRVTVRTPGGASLYESSALYPTTYAVRDTIGRQYGGLLVEASVRPDASEHLIIGGPPRSRLPIIVGLLLLSLGVGTAAVFLIRREHQLARMRDDFISGVSHELRTPLAQIRMFAELLDNGKLRTDSERERSVKVIDREARRLAHLVENILQFSWLRRAPVGLTEEATDVDATVGEVIEVFRLEARSRDASIETEIEPDARIAADRDAVKQILLNLVDNALKYGPSGQTVSIGAARVGDRVRLSVRDQGPGIPHHDRRRVWEPYQRLVDKGKDTAGGTGIGLAVVERLVSLHRGRVWAEDAPQGGTCFVVELPAARGGPEDGAE